MKVPKAPKPFTSRITRLEQQIARMAAQHKTLEKLVEAKFDSLALKSGDILMLRNIEIGPEGMEAFRELLRRNGLKDIAVFDDIQDDQDVYALDHEERKRFVDWLLSTSNVVTDDLVNRFLSWELPDTACADPCATTPTSVLHRSGTNLLSSTEARQMLEYVLQSTSVDAHS